MRQLCSAALLLAACSAFANAQVAEFGVGGGTTKLSDKTLASGYSLDDGWNLSFRLTINNWTFFGEEFGYNYNHTHLLYLGQDQGGMAVHQGFFDFIAYAIPEGKRIRPFAIGGGHFSNFVPPGASATYGQGNNKFGVNYGGGVKVRFGDRWLFRVDVRQYLQGKPFGDTLPVSGNVKLNQFSAGISFVL